MACLLWPSGNVEIVLCVHVLIYFVQNGAISQILAANPSQSGRSMRILKDLFCLMAIETLCADLCDEYCLKMDIQYNDE